QLDNTVVLTNSTVLIPVVCEKDTGSELCCRGTLFQPQPAINKLQ
ncbi:uncharacterized protein METZ01_LOCUS366826, partial [marine metagenome]